MQLHRTQNTTQNVDEATRRVFTRLFARREGSDQNVSFVVERCEPGAWFPAHAHDMEQWFFVFRGRMRFVIDGQEFLVGAGELIYTPRNAEHEGNNAADEVSEYLVIDHWPQDSEDSLGWD